MAFAICAVLCALRAARQCRRRSNDVPLRACLPKKDISAAAVQRAEEAQKLMNRENAPRNRQRAFSMSRALFLTPCWRHAFFILPLPTLLTPVFAYFSDA